jgi:uncharacterized protein YjiS (DUF1127 family)
MRNLEQHCAGGASGATLLESLATTRKAQDQVPSIAAGDGVIACLLHDIRQWLRTWAEQREARLGLMAMADLDDSMLNDIGVSRYEVDAAMAHKDHLRAISSLRQSRYERIHSVKHRWNS